MPLEFKDKKPPRPDYCQKDNFMASQRLQNIANLKSYIKASLGSPVVCVELSDEQLNYVISDAIQYFWKYAARAGNYRDYLMLELIPGHSHYKICQELESIVDFKTSDWMGTINDLFTVPHNLMYDQVMSMNNTWQGTCWGNSPGHGDILGSWTATMLWLEEVKNTFGESYQVRYNEKEKELAVWPTPKRPVRGLMEVYKRQKVENVINDVLFKELVVCKAGMLWANSMRKYSITLAGGGTVNSDSLYQSYKERYDAVVERIDKESPNGDCILLG